MIECRRGDRIPIDGSTRENVTVEVIGKICKALNCTADDIMEFIEE